MLHALLFQILAAAPSAAPFAPPAATPAQDEPAITVRTDLAEYSPGQAARVTVTAPRDGYLVLIAVDPTGEARMLFPSSPIDDDFVPGGEPVDIVDGDSQRTLQVTGPVGTAMIYAAFSSAAFDFKDFSNGNRWNAAAIDDPLMATDAEEGFTSLVERMGAGHVDHAVQLYAVVPAAQPIVSFASMNSAAPNWPARTMWYSSFVPRFSGRSFVTRTSCPGGYAEPEAAATFWWYCPAWDPLRFDPLGLYNECHVSVADFCVDNSESVAAARVGSALGAVGSSSPLSMRVRYAALFGASDGSRPTISARPPSSAAAAPIDGSADVHARSPETPGSPASLGTLRDHGALSTASTGGTLTVKAPAWSASSGRPRTADAQHGDRASGGRGERAGSSQPRPPASSGGSYADGRDGSSNGGGSHAGSSANGSRGDSGASHNEPRSAPTNYGGGIGGGAPGGSPPATSSPRTEPASSGSQSSGAGRPPR